MTDSIAQTTTRPYEWRQCIEEFFITKDMAEDIQPVNAILSEAYLMGPYLKANAPTAMPQTSDYLFKGIHAAIVPGDTFTNYKEIDYTHVKRIIEFTNADSPRRVRVLFSSSDPHTAMYHLFTVTKQTKDGTGLDSHSALCVTLIKSAVFTTAIAQSIRDWLFDESLELENWTEQSAYAHTLN